MKSLKRNWKYMYTLILKLFLLITHAFDNLNANVALEGLSKNHVYYFDRWKIKHEAHRFNNAYTMKTEKE